ncbi:unnamed protein product [Fusarium equiseti]|uniref:Uncharacterized protein n=1 Tax=Fusarium equiseti TaxID=61235 RepID=A0A8J2J202_FUSEQ|nr:unnamed protein product [Fusarium equiseti]
MKKTGCHLAHVGVVAPGLVEGVHIVQHHGHDYRNGWLQFKTKRSYGKWQEPSPCWPGLGLGERDSVKLAAALAPLVVAFKCWEVGAKARVLFSEFSIRVIVLQIHNLRKSFNC